jgi:hypothetical protein
MLGARWFSITLRFAIVLAMLAPAIARAAPTSLEPQPRKLRAFVGLGYVGSPGGDGGAVLGGLRLSMGKHLALSFDAGYSALSSKQDRWWLMPSIALVVPAGPVRFDAGAGLVLGTSSAFSTWSDFAADRTLWASQGVPAVRGHAIAAVTLTPRFELFARVDVSSQLLEGNTLGWRTGDGPTRNADTMWINLWLGGQFSIL